MIFFNLQELSGAIRWAVVKLRTIVPNAKIVLITPIQTNSLAYRLKLIKYSDCIVESSKLLSTIVVDMFSKSGINSDIESNMPKYLRDGLHPNDFGQTIMGAYATSCIRPYLLY